MGRFNEIKKVDEHSEIKKIQDNYKQMLTFNVSNKEKIEYVYLWRSTKNRNNITQNKYFISRVLSGKGNYSASRITTRRLVPRLHAAVC